MIPSTVEALSATFNEWTGGGAGGMRSIKQRWPDCDGCRVVGKTGFWGMLQADAGTLQAAQPPAKYRPR